MHLGAAHPLVPVDSSARPTLHRRAQRATIDDGNAGLRASSGSGTHQQAQVMDHGFKAPGGDPASRLLIHRLPRRKVGGQPSPRRARAHHVAHGVEDLAQIMATLRRRLGQQAQLGRDELPFFIADITGIGASVHPPILRNQRRQLIIHSWKGYDWHCGDGVHSDRLAAHLQRAGMGQAPAGRYGFVQYGVRR